MCLLIRVSNNPNHFFLQKRTPVFFKTHPCNRRQWKCCFLERRRKCRLERRLWLSRWRSRRGKWWTSTLQGRRPSWAVVAWLCWFFPWVGTRWTSWLGLGWRSRSTLSTSAQSRRGFQLAALVRRYQAATAKIASVKSVF